MVGPAKSREQRLWDQAKDDWWWLHKFNLTPDQVDTIPLQSFNRIPYIESEFVTLQNEAQERANRG